MKRIKSILRDKEFWKNSWIFPGALYGIATTALTFVNIERELHRIWLLTLLLTITFIYIFICFLKSVFMKQCTLNIDGSEIEIKKGNIFEFPRNVYKVIAFNEFYDTQVDDNIISTQSLNGQYIRNFYSDTNELDKKILDDQRLQARIIEHNVARPLGGKNIRYRLGSIFKDMDFFLVAFSKFDDENKAHLKLNEYASCLINFWNEVNSLYSQKEVVVPLLGSGITRHKDFDASPHQLLEVMLWTFKISKVKFREPSKITIVLHNSNYKKINFYKLKEFEKNGI